MRDASPRWWRRQAPATRSSSGSPIRRSWWRSAIAWRITARRPRRASRSASRTRAAASRPPARALLLLVSPAAPFPVERLSDLADPRLAGRVAIPPFTDGERTALVGALSASAGEAAASRLLAGIARNRPVLAVSDEDVPARIGRGEAWVGLASSEAAAAGAASAAGLEVVYPDQRDRGAVILPTAVAPARGSPPAALALATWLAGAEAEQLLVARVPGLVPLRDGVPVPVGVRPAMALRVVALDWDLLAEKKREARAALEGWPERWAR